jgi:hypothetical protein
VATDPLAVVDRHPVVIERLALVEDTLDAFRGALGTDHAAYRGHVYRVVNFCRALAAAAAADAGREDKIALAARDQKIALAAIYHDLGIWSDATADYLPPSARRLRVRLERDGRQSWSAELERMVLLHHKLTACRGADDALVEAFRRADLVDLTLGWVRFGLPASFVGEVQGAFPTAGFHRRVVQIVSGWALAHPLRPFPMLRL